MSRVDGLLLDIDGVLAVSWIALPGAVEALASLRNDGIAFRLITNTTTHSRKDLAATLRDAGFDVDREEIVTAVTATAAYLRHYHADRRVFVLTDGDPSDDLEGIKLVEAPEDADVLVLGGASDAFTYDTLNRIFRRVFDGAPLVGMHRNLFWKTAEGWELDGGAYVEALETAAGVSATICGKPAPAFFEAALRLLGIPAPNVAMVGDDIVNDVEGARAAGLAGVLVRTGKFRGPDLTKGSPDAVLDSFAEVPEWLRRQA
jgi:HAD superfamily hydrolase (TIGR01458 family)